MDDGVPLAATLYEPDGLPPALGWPAIVMFHGLGGTRRDLDSLAQAWAGEFAVLTFDARGHGQSGGLVSIDGPREIRDSRAVFEWLAARLEIDRTHIGAWGLSLGGGAVLRSLVEGVPWAAVETVATWTDLYGALAPQNLAKSGAVFQFLNSVPQDRLDPSVLAIKEDALRSRNLPALRRFAAARSTRARLARVTTPVYLFQGRRDFAFDISQASAAYRLLRGPKLLYVGDFGHAPSTFPGPDFVVLREDGELWFKRWLQGVDVGAFTRFSLAADPWRNQTCSYDHVPLVRRLEGVLPGRSRLAPGTKTVRTTPRLRTGVETFGAAEVHVTARGSGGWSRLVAVLTATTPDGKEILVSEGGINTRGLRGTRRLTIKLLDDATAIPRGSRLSVTLASNSLAQNPANLLYLNLPMSAGARISLGPVRLVVPLLRKRCSP